MTGVLGRDVRSNDPRMSAGYPARKLPLWADFSFLNYRPQPQYGWDFAEEIPENFRNFSPETLSELFLEFPLRVRLGSPKPYKSRHLMPPDHFQNSLSLNTAGNASFFRSGSGDCLS